MGDDNQFALMLSMVVAAVVSTLQAIEQKIKFTSAIINMMIAGFAAPTVVWLLWSDAPFYVYSLVAAVTAKWPDIIKGAAERFGGTK